MKHNHRSLLLRYEARIYRVPFYTLLRHLCEYARNHFAALRRGTDEQFPQQCRPSRYEYIKTWKTGLHAVMILSCIIARLTFVRLLAAAGPSSPSCCWTGQRSAATTVQCPVPDDESIRWMYIQSHHGTIHECARHTTSDQLTSCIL